MIEYILTWARRQPVFAFYILAFVITWLGWIPQAAHSHGFFPFDSPLFYVFGGIGPLVAALIVASALYGKRNGEEVFKPLWYWRVGIVWYIVALCGSIAIMLTSVCLKGELAQGLARLTPSFALILTFLKYLLAAIPEEVAWRGFVLPRLQSHYSALISSLIVGFLWTLWHLPLLFIKGSIMATYPLIPFFLGTIASAILYTWLYNNSSGSVLIVTIFHAVSNTVGPSAGPEQTFVLILLAIIIVISFGPSHLSRRGKRIVRKDWLSPRGEAEDNLK
jgi:membrane protease YdiL (CAAX protease family)